jgi:hypothetical protein
MRLQPTRRALPGWMSCAAFGIAGLAAIAAHAWPVEIGRAPDPRPTTAAPTADGSALVRPLFDPGRRGWTARGGRDLLTQGDPLRPVLRVRGILLDGGRARTLIDDGSGDGSWLTTGEGRGDWTIAAIAPDGVRVAQRGRTYDVAFMGQSVTLRPVLPPGRIPPEMMPVGLRP